MNKLSLRELEQIEELAHRSGTAEAVVVLRLAADLLQALQEKENAVAIAAQIKRTKRE